MAHRRRGRGLLGPLTPLIGAWRSRTQRGWNRFLRQTFRPAD